MNLVPTPSPLDRIAADVEAKIAAADAKAEAARAEARAARAEVAELRGLIAGRRRKRREPNPAADAELFEALWQDGDGPAGKLFPVKQVMRLAKAASALLRLIWAAVGEDGDTATRLGKWLGRVAGQSFGGRMVVKTELKEDGAWLWEFRLFERVGDNPPEEAEPTPR